MLTVKQTKDNRHQMAATDNSVEHQSREMTGERRRVRVGIVIRVPLLL